MTPSDLSPHLYFFGHAVDAGTELDLLADFAVRIQALLDDAASKASHDVRPMSDTELIFAEDLSHVYSEIHGTMFHEAFLISAVIFVERTLAIYTDGLQQAMGIGLALKDIAGSGLERFRTYCTKLAQIDPAPDCWEDMK